MFEKSKHVIHKLIQTTVIISMTLEDQDSYLLM